MPYHLAMSPRKDALERETGFEPATSTLARLHSTTELLPRGVKRLIGDSWGSVNRKKTKKRFFSCVSFSAGRKRGRIMDKGRFCAPVFVRCRLFFPCFLRFSFLLSAARRPPCRLRFTACRFLRSSAFFLPLRAERGAAPCPPWTWAVPRGIQRCAAPCRKPAWYGRRPQVPIR